LHALHDSFYTTRLPELEFAYYFWLGKLDFMHWDWTGIHQKKKQLKMGMGLRFEQDSQ
jgi:hypothetical protein